MEEVLPGVERSEGRHLFALMTAHPAEHGIEHPDRVDDVGALVQHDAFGAFRHGGIGQFGPGGEALLGQGFENLGGPDHRNVGGFANPEQLFLDLRQPDRAEFHRQIAPRDHHSQRPAAEAMDNDFGKVLDR